jgi:hypothetical protein
MRSQTIVVEEASGRHLAVKSAEDTVLRKLEWYRMGGEVSERRWLDVIGIPRVRQGQLDDAYLERWSRELGIDDLLRKALQSL